VGGAVHRGRGSGHYTYRNERQVIYRLLKLIEDYGIRATWAVVGHLFLSECQSVGGHKHPEITRPPYSWFEQDWFDADPCSDENAHPMWYGRDIVARILECTVPQEIGSHTFSHIIVGDPDCRPEDFDSELRRCRQLAKSHGITLKSFVFPRNSVGHLNVLANNGFVAYRGRTPTGRLQSRPLLRELPRSLGAIWPIPTTPIFPRHIEGLWNIPGTYYYNPRVWRFISNRHRVNRQINQAIRQSGLVHMWFHAHDLASDPDKSLKGLEAIFRKVNNLREKGNLDNPTMGELAGRLAGLPDS